MLQKCNNFIIKNKNIKSKALVNLPVSLFKSIQGKYFVGQTETLWVGKGISSWAGLVNPHNSNVNLYANVFTISNFSNDPLTAEIWLNTNLPDKGSLSHKVSPTNTTLKPPSKNKVNIYFKESTTLVPQNGVNIYERIVPPNTTLVGEEDGKFIESPGGNYVIVIKSDSSTIHKAVIAFGWWEKSIHCN